MKKKNLLFSSFLILSFSVLPQFENGQDPQVHHLKCIGGTGEDNILYVIKLRDGNFLSSGSTNSHNGDFDAKNGGLDAFLIKTDNAGNIIWKNTYGGSRDEVFYNIIESITGDIIAIGTSGSNDKQVTNHHGTPGTDDIWLVKTNSNGQLIKERCFGGSESESTVELGMSEGLMIDKNGNILFVGQTKSNNGDVSGNHGDYDGWLVKVNPQSFDIVTSKTIGDAAYDAAYNIYEINGYLFVTGSKSTVAYIKGEDVEANGKAFATKLDPLTLNTVWYKIYGGSGSEYCNASVISQDSNLVLAGHASSTDGDCVGNSGGFNTWTWKVDINNGSILWKNFTGVSNDTSSAFNLIATQDGGFSAVGIVVESFNPDAFVVKIDANGKTQWTKKFGGSRNDQIQGGVEQNNGTLLLGGLTSSNDGDVSGFHGGPVVKQKIHRFPASDAWLIALRPN